MRRRLYLTAWIVAAVATINWAQVRPIVTPGGGSGSGGAPTDATYITQTANGDLSAEQALAALGTGLVLNETKTGVLSIFTPSAACAAGQYVTALSASGATTCTAQAAPSWPITAPTGATSVIRTGTTAADTLTLSAYDVDGTAYVPLITLTSNNTTGLAFGGYPSFSSGFTASTKMDFNYYVSNRLGFSSDSYVGWGSSTTNAGGDDLQLRREAAAVLQLGADVNGSAVAQTLKAHDGITGTDIAGANLTLAAGRGTGAGAPGTLIFQTATALSTGTTAQTLATRLIIGATGAATLGTTAGTGAGAFYAGSYFVGTTAGADCSSATAVTTVKGIVTVCSEPDPEMTPAALYTRILSLESQLAALQAAQRQ